MFPFARATISEFNSSIIRMNKTRYPDSHALTTYVYVQCKFRLNCMRISLSPAFGFASVCMFSRFNLHVISE